MKTVKLCRGLLQSSYWYIYLSPSTAVWVFEFTNSQLARGSLTEVTQGCSGHPFAFISPLALKEVEQMISTHTLSWLDLKTDLETKPITNCEQQLFKGLLNICSRTEFNHITSQPSLPKKIKSPPSSVVSRRVLGLRLQGALPSTAETLTALWGHHWCASVALLVCCCCLPSEAVVWETEGIAYMHSSRRWQFTYPFLPLPPPNQPTTLPARYSAPEESLFFLF